MTQLGHEVMSGGSDKVLTRLRVAGRRDPFMTHAAEKRGQIGSYRAIRRVPQSFSRRPDRAADLRLYMERVTGIEPAWPAWKAWASKRHLRWSAPCQPDAVPSTCLRATSRTWQMSVFGSSPLSRVPAVSVSVGQRGPSRVVEQATPVQVVRVAWLTRGAVGMPRRSWSLTDSDARSGFHLFGLRTAARKRSG